MFYSKLYKQSDGYTSGGPLLVTFSNIYLTKIEAGKVKLTRPLFYKRFVDDIIIRGKKSKPDSLLIWVSNYHPNIYLTVGANLCSLLDNDFTGHLKLLNGLNAELSWSYQIGMNFFHEKKTIVVSFTKQTEYELIIPDLLYVKPNKFALVEILFCINNENIVKDFSISCEFCATEI